MNVRLALELYKNMGFRYVKYRIIHELEKKTGRLKARHPQDLRLENPVSVADWRNEKKYFNFSDLPHLDENSKVKLKEVAERILADDVLFFNAEWHHLGKEYDWITNPINNFRYNIAKHWSEIQDLSEEAGDIKYVWEKSRFSWLLSIIRYDHYFETDLSEFVFKEIESWIDHNPINMGPNWRCSQEVSLRIFNWYFALCYYQNSKALTSERWAKIQQVIFASLHHVYHHIDFSRIAVRNNHAITETLFLALSNIMFPFIAQTQRWSKDGRKWFEQEIAYQIYDDGTFLQFSMNYHRVVIQLLTLGLSVAERAGNPFSKLVYKKAYASVEFLYQCLQEENGWLPNYGSNDGALFFPWSNTDYRDYRPQLNALHYFLTGTKFYADSVIAAEVNWWNLSPSKIMSFDPIRKFEGIKEYPVGGYIIIRDVDSFTFVRCGDHKDRPAHADNMHLDIWVKGENILRDSGTYKYNTSLSLLNYFMGSASHNTVMVNGKSQMLKGSRFIWYYWTQKKNSVIQESEDAYIFDGTIAAFQYLNKKAKHSRKITKIKGQNRWIVNDQVWELDNLPKEQIWHLDDANVSFIAKENDVNLKADEITSFRSDYYGLKEDGRGIAFTFKNAIETLITIN